MPRTQRSSSFWCRLAEQLALRVSCDERLDEDNAALDAQQRTRLKAFVATASVGLIGLTWLIGGLWAFLVSLIVLMGLIVWGHDLAPLISPEHLR
jgi:hypothetical protein